MKATDTFTCHLEALEEVFNREDMLMSSDLAMAAFKSVDTPEDEVQLYRKAWNKKFGQVKHNRKES